MGICGRRPEREALGRGGDYGIATGLRISKDNCKLSMDCNLNFSGASKALFSPLSSAPPAARRNDQLAAVVASSAASEASRGR